MVLKIHKGGFATPCSEGLVALRLPSPSLSQGGEKSPMHAQKSSILVSANRSPNNGKDTKTRELQIANIEDDASRRFSQRQRRLELEKDVDRLRKKLRHEEDLHRALQRAFRRPPGARPRFPPFAPPKTQELLAEVAVLEEEVFRLEERIGQLKHNLYQKAVHVPSCSKQKEAASNAEHEQSNAKISPLRRSPSWSSLSAHAAQETKQDPVISSLLDDISKKPDRNLKTGGLHRKQASLGSLSETKCLFYLTQSIDGNHSLYNERGFEEEKTVKSLKAQQKNSMGSNIGNEKENQLHIGDKKKLISLSPVSKKLHTKEKNLNPSPPVSKGLHTREKKNLPPLSPGSKGSHTREKKNLPPLSPVSKGSHTGEKKNLPPLSPVSKGSHTGEKKNPPPFSPVSKGSHTGEKKNLPPLSPVSKGLHTGDKKNLRSLSPVSVGSHTEEKKKSLHPPFLISKDSHVGHDKNLYSVSLVSNNLQTEDKKKLQFLSRRPKEKTQASKHLSFVQRVMEIQPPTPKGKTGHTEAVTCFGPRKLPTGKASEDGKLTHPNKLSEEIMNCLLSIYSKVTCPSLVDDTSPVVSRSTLSSVSLRSYGSRSSLTCKTPMECSEGISFLDPYGVCSKSVPRDIGPYKHYHDINTSSIYLSRVPSSAFLLRRLRILVNKLCSVDLRGLTYYQKLAFWINIYNACMMHAFLEHGIPSTPEKIVSLMCKAPLNVGGHSMSALAIEHFVLRPPFHSTDAYWKNGKSEEEAMIRSVYGLEWPEPKVTFALCCGSRSSPALRVYTALGVEKELEVAKKEYLQAAIGVTSMKVLIPKLLESYMRDFAKDIESLVDWICEQLPSSLRSAVEECLKGKRNGFISEAVEVMPYEFGFRYILPL